MMTRRDVLLGSSALAFKIASLGEQDDTAYLKQLVLDVLEASRVKPGTNGPPGWGITNTGGFPLVTPGKGGYPAFWVRDFSMAADSGLVPSEEIRNHLFLIAKTQNGPETRKLKNGLELPPWSIADHINFDGKPVFYPGTYASGEDQGDGAFGFLPPIDDHFEFIHLAYLLFKQTRSKGFLGEMVEGVPLLERLDRAFLSPGFDPATELAATTLARRAVGFGFCDAIVHDGKLLMASLLRHRAASELEELTGRARYRETQRRIELNVPRTFNDPTSGWLLASTGTSGQPDVWGTLRALAELPLAGGVRSRAEQEVRKAVKAGTILLEGAVRHVPIDRDFSASSAWERAYPAKGSYQNGAYWHTPAGWLLHVLHRLDPKLSRQVLADFVSHLKANDLRLGKQGLDAPWECFGPNGTARQNGGYLASVALPFAEIRTWR
ncbi:MAG: hypothetical protein HZC36_02645 [Armatimonadetes bacterium]|nr:hypothetical protein [Armatimonadota bacterium]